MASPASARSRRPDARPIVGPVFFQAFRAGLPRGTAPRSRGLDAAERGTDIPDACDGCCGTASYVNAGGKFLVDASARATAAAAALPGGGSEGAGVSAFEPREETADDDGVGCGI